MRSMTDTLLNLVMPIVGWPRSIFRDNGSHFMGKEVQERFLKFRVTHFSTSICSQLGRTLCEEAHEQNQIVLQ